jgi:uncharacterized membrane protein
VIEGVQPVVPHIKALHIAMLALWTAGLYALPQMLSRHDPAIGQADYARIRRATHFGYVFLVTPAAVLAIASGTLLIFLREVFDLWLFAKLVCVAGLVTFHAWVGHVIVLVAETDGHHTPPEPFLPAILVSVPIAATLALVLGKPDLAQIPVPGWLAEPHGLQLPFDVPRR